MMTRLFLPDAMKDFNFTGLGKIAGIIMGNIYFEHFYFAATF